MQINAYVYNKKFASYEKIPSATTAFDKGICNAIRGRSGYRESLGYTFKCHSVGQISDLYYRNFKTNLGAPTKDARLVLGVIIIKHMLKLDDVGVIEMIQENPYMQYFLGLRAFSKKPVMDPSLLVHIRKRIDLNVFEAMTDELIKKGLGLKAKPNGDTEVESDYHHTTPPAPKNKGKLQLDATVADADIKFPADLDMLNDCREKAEDLIDHICKETNVTERPRTYRKVARKGYLSVSKMKRKTDKALRRALRLQINYVKRDIKIINGLMDRNQGKPLFDKHQLMKEVTSRCRWSGTNC